MKKKKAAALVAVEEKQIADSPSLKESNVPETLPMKKETGLSLISPFNLPAEEDKPVKYSPFLPGSAPIEAGKPYTPTLYYIADVLRRQGILNPNQLKIALISFVAANSAALYNPLAVEIVDDHEIAGLNLLTEMSKVTPERNKIELSDASPKTLFREKDRLQGRAILVYDGKNFKNPSSLNQLLERQGISKKETVTAKYGEIFQEIEVQGPVSCVVVNKNPRQLILNSPAFLRFQMNSADTIPIPSMLGEEGRENLDLIRATVKSSLKRLRPAHVKIPFSDQIIKALASSKAENVSERCQTFFKMIKVITLMNNPPTLYGKELHARLVEFDNAKMVDGMVPKVIMSTKVDYFTFWVLMNEYKDDQNTLTARQLRVFQAIKNFNVKFVENATFSQGSSNVDILVGISDVEAAWPSQEKILEELGKDGGEEINLSTLYRELKELERKEVIRHRKDSKARNKIIYAVNTLSVGQNIQLPHPSEIEDPVFNKKSIPVINPITGDVETV